MGRRRAPCYAGAVPHLLRIQVLASDIDELGHASNLTYLRWVLQAAVSHSTAVGLGTQSFRDRGQAFVVHRHELDYVMIQISGDRMAADFEPDSGGPWGGAGRVEGEIAPGNVLWGDRGGIETAINVGERPFYEIVVELKD